MSRLLGVNRPFVCHVYTVTLVVQTCVGSQRCVRHSCCHGDGASAGTSTGYPEITSGTAADQMELFFLFVDNHMDSLPLDNTETLNPSRFKISDSIAVIYFEWNTVPTFFQFF